MAAADFAGRGGQREELEGVRGAVVAGEISGVLPRLDSSNRRLQPGGPRGLQRDIRMPLAANQRDIDVGLVRGQQCFDVRLILLAKRDELRQD